jgi:phospholipid-binding lipoprotein MlaA
MRRRGNAMKYFALNFMLLAVLFICCTNELAAESLYDTVKNHSNPTPDLICSGAVQSPSNSGEMEEDLSSEDLDFLEEEVEEEIVQVADPLKPWNRAMFHFNDKLYFWLIKPVAQGYRFVMPEEIRMMVKNFFNNLAAPIRMTNSMLQGKWSRTWTEFARFFINSTVGILGFGDPASTSLPGIEPSEEDLGQTLGYYGIGNGIYIVWPFLGPSTIRDTVGWLGDRFLSPNFYVRPVELALGIRVYETVNTTSFRIGDYEDFKEAAIEPYEAFRDAYIQHRNTLVEE